MAPILKPAAPACEPYVCLNGVTHDAPGPCGLCDAVYLAQRVAAALERVARLEAALGIEPGDEAMDPATAAHLGFRARARAETARQREEGKLS